MLRVYPRAQYTIRTEYKRETDRQKTDKKADRQEITAHYDAR